MSQPMIILYDVPSNVPQPWAPNVWRIRLILNYKRLPYRTSWVEFPDIEKTMRAINAPPTSIRPDGRPVYTLPALLDPTRVQISNQYPVDPFPSLSPSSSSSSFPQMRPIVLTHPDTIADYLEHTYPARPVVPEGTRALQTLFAHYISEIFVQPLLPIMLPLSHQRLPPHVQHHFQVPSSIGVLGDQGHDHGQYQHHDSSGAGAGVGRAQPQQPSQHRASISTSDDHARQRREAQWAVVRTHFTFLSRILDKNAGDGDGDGVVVTGHELTYADFAICSVLIWIEKVTPHEGWARVREWDGGRWWRLWERCKEYMDVF